jgi:PAS domain S-box-containing protein
MLTDKSPDIQFSQLLDALPDAVIWMKTIRDKNNQIIDFRIDYVNKKAESYSQGKYQVSIGTLLLGDNQHDQVHMAHIFKKMCVLYETGQPDEDTYFNTILNGWYLISRSKLGDGVLSVTRDISSLKAAEQEKQSQTELLQTILDTSLNNIFVYEAIRDTAGQIQDFRVRLANPAGRQDVMDRYGKEVLGNTLLGFRPSSRETGQFNLFCQVIETGKPVWAQHYYPDVQEWYDTAITKLGDGCVVTGVNITQQKQDLLRYKRLSDLLNSVLNSSPNGIKAMEAVRETAPDGLPGKIIDFVVTVINKAGANIRGYAANDIVGKRALEVFPDLQQTELFDQYCNVTETGDPQHSQSLHGDVWYDMALAPFGNGLVITYTNITESKRVKQVIEEAAAENKRQADLLNSVLDNSTNGIMAFESIRDESGVITDFKFIALNKAASLLSGRSPDDMIGQSMLSIFPGNAKSGMMEMYIHTVETGERTSMETYYDYDRLDFWIAVSALKLGDGFVVTFSDISEAKRAQQQISQTADLLQTVINNSPTALVLYEPIRDESNEVIDFRYKLTNPVAATATGRSLEYMQGNTLFTMFPMAAQKGFFDRLRVVLKTGEMQQYEHHFSDDGVDLWAEITMVKQENDVLTVFQYITDLKRAQQELERSRAELQTVIDTSQTGIFLFSPVRDETGSVIDFRFRVANRQLASYVGQDPESVVGVLGSTWFPDYKNNGLFELYNKTYQTGEPQRFDFHYDGGGIDAWLDIMSTKMGDEVLVTFGDYTSLKQLQQQLETSVIELQRSNRNLEQFAYVASHDLQEPLRKIQAFGDIIKAQYAPLIGDSGADMIQRMQSAAARMQVLIKDVLAYSRVSAKREEHKPVHLNSVVAEVLIDLETFITEKKAVVTVGQLPVIMGDIAQLRQLFQNLISNSLKFAQVDRIPEITISSSVLRGRESGLPIPPPENNQLFHAIELTDNGIGFDPHYAERIFQVFQRLHGRSEYQGTGIGLAIVQKVVENHKGHIAADGRPGEGATFRILLPSSSN